MEDPAFDELRTFKSLSDSENALFVSWLYFSDTVKEVANRLFEHAAFWSIGDVVAALTANYEKMSSDLKSNIPLKRIWILDRQ